MLPKRKNVKKDHEKINPELLVNRFFKVSGWNSGHKYLIKEYDPSNKKFNIIWFYDVQTITNVIDNNNSAYYPLEDVVEYIKEKTWILEPLNQDSNEIRN